MKFYKNNSEKFTNVFQSRKIPFVWINCYIGEFCTFYAKLLGLQTFNSYFHDIPKFSFRKFSEIKFIFLLICGGEACKKQLCLVKEPAHMENTVSISSDSIFWIES